MRRGSGEDSIDWEAMRAQMPVAEQWAYFDHSAVGPIPRDTAKVIESWLNEVVTSGDVQWPQWKRDVEGTRQLAAESLNVDPAEIALVPNTTTGIGIVSEGFPWQPGDNVVTVENEFPSNLYPWLHLERRGVETRRVPAPQGRVDLNRLLEHCDARTRIVSVSWVGYATGWRLDPVELAAAVHARGALVMLDAIQGMGVFPLDVSSAGIDFLSADGHKWMLGPEGAGFCYVRREHLPLLTPTIVGWSSVQNAYDYARPELRLRDDAAKFEPGSQNMVGFLGLGASLRLLRDYGWTHDSWRLADRVLSLADELVAKLMDLGAELISPHEGDHRSGIVTFRLAQMAPEEIRRACRDAGVVVSCRGGGVRASVHAYNNEQDIDQLIGVVRDVRQR